MSDDVRDFVRQFGKLPDELKKELRPGLRAAGKIVKAESDRRASWSRRIPRATGVRTAFTGRRTGVSVVVSRKKAPHGRAYENQGKSGTFRHPVPPGRRRWVAQPARPFLHPALQAKGDAAAGEIGKAVDRVSKIAMR